jgi:aminoglycoside phosphotransferase (APT) family kinase protein
MSGEIVTPVERDLRALASRLQDWMRANLADANGLTITDVDYPRGAGKSHETILVETEKHGGFVFRCKPTSHTVFPDNLFVEQYRLMEMLGRDGRVKVAKTLWLEDDDSLLGAPFFLMERIYGQVPVSNPPYAREGWVAEASPGQRRILWESAVQQLAALQTVPVEAAPFLAGPQHARDGLLQEWDKYSRFVDWVQGERKWPVLEEGLARLKALWPANQPAGIVWGDARIGNMMFGDDFQVRAVMDWEQPSLGGALHDLGWFLVLSQTMHAGLEGMGSREETIALWEQASGKSAADIEWYEDFAHLKMSCTGVRLWQLGTMPLPDEAWLAKRLKVG